MEPSASFQDLTSQYLGGNSSNLNTTNATTPIADTPRPKRPRRWGKWALSLAGMGAIVISIIIGVFLVQKQQDNRSSADIAGVPFLTIQKQGKFVGTVLDLTEASPTTSYQSFSVKLAVTSQAMPSQVQDSEQSDSTNEQQDAAVLGKTTAQNIYNRDEFIVRPTAIPKEIPTTEPSIYPRYKPTPTPTFLPVGLITCDPEAEMVTCPRGMECNPVEESKTLGSADAIKDIKGVCESVEQPTPTPNTGNTSGVIPCQTTIQVDQQSCPTNMHCYQPSMPRCPAGTACAQVMPIPICVWDDDYPLDNLGEQKVIYSDNDIMVVAAFAGAINYETPQVTINENGQNEVTISGSFTPAISDENWSYLRKNPQPLAYIYNRTAMQTEYAVSEQSIKGQLNGYGPVLELTRSNQPTIHPFPTGTPTPQPPVTPTLTPRPTIHPWPNSCSQGGTIVNYQEGVENCPQSSTSWTSTQVSYTCREDSSKQLLTSTFNSCKNKSYWTDLINKDCNSRCEKGYFDPDQPKPSIYPRPTIHPFPTSSPGPTSSPTIRPTVAPTARPTNRPSPSIYPRPTRVPTPMATYRPTTRPTARPQPTIAPTPLPWYRRWAPRIPTFTSWFRSNR